MSQDGDLVAEPPNPLGEDRLSLEPRHLPQQRPRIDLTDDGERHGLPIGDLGPRSGELERDVVAAPTQLIRRQPQLTQKRQVAVVEQPLLVCVDVTQEVELALGERQRARVVEMFAKLTEIDQAAEFRLLGAVRQRECGPTFRYFRQMSCPIVNL